MTAERRELGRTEIEVSPVAMGCWPIAGMTSLNVTKENSLATLVTAFECGINFFDTAYCYGAEGESERLIAEALGARRDEIVIATKCGIHWNNEPKQVIDGRPDVLRRECDESLLRLNTDRVELLYLHAPDPATPIEESAAALKELLDAGKARSIGGSNFSLEQLKRFHQVCPLTAYQPAYNMLQRQIEHDVLPWCRENGVSVCPYWPLRKGLLAGKLTRDHVFEDKDGRKKYPMFQGEEWEKNQDFVDCLREIANEAGKTVGQIAVNWAFSQPGITSALCGAKRPDQIEESAGAMGWGLSDAQLQKIDDALVKRGEPKVRTAV